MKRIPPIFVALLVLASPLVLSASGKVNFARDIRPILNAKCTGCHGGVKQAGGVSFVYEDQVINFEGDTGYPVVVPKDVEESELFFRITLPADDIERMPPADEHPEGLTENEIALIRQWIEEGASWSEHWSFESPEEPALPLLSEENVAAKNIDHFILAKLQAEGLSPSDPAEP
ncbi:MAG: c-type cytochrome domain-containing protein, partial [Verrucomicrobiota bacterium]